MFLFESFEHRLKFEKLSDEEKYKYAIKQSNQSTEADICYFWKGVAWSYNKEERKL